MSHWTCGCHPGHTAPCTMPALVPSLGSAFSPGISGDSQASSFSVSCGCHLAVVTIRAAGMVGKCRGLGSWLCPDLRTHRSQATTLA